MKGFKSLLILTVIFLMSGCQSKQVSDYDKIQEKLVSMESYSCDASLKYISARSENDYEIKQFVKNNGTYRIETTAPDEVKGNVVLFDGKMIWQFNPAVESKISINTPDKPERVQINLFTFMQNFVNSQDVSVESSSMDESLCTVLEAVIPGENKYFATEKLWVSNETKLPVKLVIYDSENNERAVITFKNFEYNPKLEETLFKL